MDREARDRDPDQRQVRRGVEPEEERRSLPTKFSGSCIRFIHSMIEKVVSVMISFLVAIAAIAKAARRTA